MTGSIDYSTLIQITIVLDEKGVYVATSSTLEGFLAVSKDKTKLEDQIIPKAIGDLYQACGTDVVVSRLESDPREEQPPWVATPIEFAKKRLEELSL